MKVNKGILHIIWIVIRWTLAITATVLACRHIVNYANITMENERVSFQQKDLDLDIEELKLKSEATPGTVPRSESKKTVSILELKKIVSILEKVHNQEYAEAMNDIEDFKNSHQEEGKSQSNEKTEKIVKVPDNIVKFLTSFSDVYTIYNDKKEMKKYKKKQMPAEDFIFNNISVFLKFLQETGIPEAKAIQFTEVIPFYCIVQRAKNDKIVLQLSETYVKYISSQMTGKSLTEEGALVVCIYCRSLYRDTKRLLEVNKEDAQHRYKEVQDKINALKKDFSKDIGTDNPNFVNYAGYLDRLHKQCEKLSNAMDAHLWNIPIGTLANKFASIFDDRIPGFN